MYAQFTEQAQAVMKLAILEAETLHYEYVGTEHILLAIFQNADCKAYQILLDLEIGQASVVIEVLKMTQPAPDEVILGKLPLTPRAKNAYKRAIEEAKRLQSDLADTDHLLLGLLIETGSVAAQVLTKLRPDIYEKVCTTLGAEVIQLLVEIFVAVPPEQLANLKVLLESTRLEHSFHGFAAMPHALHVSPPPLVIFRVTNPGDQRQGLERTIAGLGGIVTDNQLVLA